MAMAGARIVAAADAQIGLPELRAGLIPAGCGCKELVRRVLSPVMKLAPNADPYPFVQNLVQTIATARVSPNAEGAWASGFLAPTDRVVADRHSLLFEAKRDVLELAGDIYAPPVREKNCYAAGRDVHAAVCATAYMAQQGGYIAEYDAFLTGKLASVICGGDLSAGQWVDEQYFLDREREVFVALCGEKKTADRVRGV
jgi:3-hydroxyacyl-CoA dehydrogenase